MGYTTEFEGSFEITPALTKPQRAYLDAFHRLRHMPLNTAAIERLRIPDPLREKVKLPVGCDGIFFTGIIDGGYMSEPAEGVAEFFRAADDDQLAELLQAVRASTDRNTQNMLGREKLSDEKVFSLIKRGHIPFPIVQDYNGFFRDLSFYCQWQVDKAGKSLAWDTGEKFYKYVPWLRFMVDNFFKPWGRKLNGEVGWRGETFDDCGTITLSGNILW